MIIRGMLVMLVMLPLMLEAEERSLREICFPNIGCFRNDGNFVKPPYRIVSLLPQSPDKIGTRFLLFTRKNKNSPQMLQFNKGSSVSNSNFNPSRKTKIIIHGYLETPEMAWMTQMKDALLQHGDYNVILHDWSNGAKGLYSQAVANTRVAGAVIAQMLQWLVANFNLRSSNVHLLGHSLGGHVSGYAGERMSPKLGRITGLDPAGPYFEFMHPEVRLDETDASFVDVIHTDGNRTLTIPTKGAGFGLMEPCGHVDFYPNGGRSQPGCEGREGIVNWCHHRRSHALMTATIVNYRRDYNAVPCDSFERFMAGRCSCGSIGCASFGINADKWNSRGRKHVRMFLRTTDRPPFEKN